MGVVSYNIDWPVLSAIFTALVASAIALYGSWRANRIAEKNLSASIDLELFRHRERRVSELREAISEFVSSASAIKKNDQGHLWRDDVAATRKFSSKIQLLMDTSDEDFEILLSLMMNELGAASPEEKKQISGEHIYTVGRRILKRADEKIENEIRRYNAKN
ncbi:hypothetical protein [Litorimonas sp. WD9-15]|uniref:hypothetical protein n=1 Tax=Litorimonas sp. WD9-15 TaxID=3418716 RepID=UPI003D00FF17